MKASYIAHNPTLKDENTVMITITLSVRPNLNIFKSNYEDPSLEL